MQKENKAILEEANTFVADGNYDGFLPFCTDDIKWNFVGERILDGKEAVRQYMATTYTEPPKFTVDNTIAEGDFLTVLGEITLKDENGRAIHHSYCDVWRFRNGKIAELKAFVIKTDVR
jgi:uncharacterized protein